MFVFEHNEFMLFTTHKSEAYNTNTYISFFLLHAVVRWKGLVDRVQVPCVMYRLPPWGWARNKIRWLALLRLCLSCGNGMLNSIAIGVPVHGRVWRRRNVCLFGVVVWGCKEMDTCFLLNDWEGNKLKIWLQTTLQKTTRLQLLLREILNTKRWSEYESNWWNHTQNLFPMGSRSRFSNTAYCRFVRTFYWNHCLFFKMKLSHTHLHILTRSTRCYLVKFCQNCWTSRQGCNLYIE